MKQIGYFYNVFICYQSNNSRALAHRDNTNEKALLLINKGLFQSIKMHYRYFNLFLKYLSIND
jgi:hypothetical protein